MAKKDQEQQPQAASEPEAPTGPVPDEETEEQPAGSEPVDLPAAEPVEEDAAEAVVAEETAVAEAEPAPDVEAVTAEAEAPAPAEPEPKPKRKRLPRVQRPVRGKPKREKPKARKPIVRQPKPEAERGRRQERRGVVVSSAMDKTIVVKVDTIKAHPRYKKVVRRSSKLHAHDESNQAKVGDVVRLVETRPLSKTKHWRLAEIVEAAR
jgi:small subunit ribosomal protein S17